MLSKEMRTLSTVYAVQAILEPMGFFSPIKAARRKRLFKRFPLSDEIWEWAISQHRILRGLVPEESTRLRFLATVFLTEKIFHPVDGALVDERFKVSVAAQACLPLVGLEEGLEWYEDWSTIIVTPREYDVKKHDVDEAGVVHEYDDEFAGEAFDLGPVVLSRVDVEASGWGDGYNVVIHEMAHKLDGRDGEFDGAPPLRPGMDSNAWREAFSAAYADLRAKAAAPASRRKRGKPKAGRGPRIDVYGAESPDEFFAVVCEYFFERPELLAGEYPEVFSLLKAFFGRDPSASAAPCSSGSEASLSPIS